MKNLFLTLGVCCFTATTFASTESIMGLHCGTRGTLLGTIASEVLIPDYFPPESPLLRMLLGNPLFIDFSLCEESPAYLGQSCMEHDACYATLGATKDSCDDELLESWRNSCNDTYAQTGSFADTACLFTCQAVVNMMYSGLVFDMGGMCPSCVAFENAQKNAQGGR